MKLQRRPVPPRSDQHPKPVGLLKPLFPVPSLAPPSGFKPFIFTGSVSLSDDNQQRVHVQILRDTGAVQSVILSGVLPWSVESSCHYNVLLQGIELGYGPALSPSLHW